MERQHIVATLRQVGGHRGKAAALLEHRSEDALPKDPRLPDHAGGISLAGVPSIGQLTGRSGVVPGAASSADVAERLQARVVMDSPRVRRLASALLLASSPGAAEPTTFKRRPMMNRVLVIDQDRATRAAARPRVPGAGRRRRDGRERVRGRARRSLTTPVSLIVVDTRPDAAQPARARDALRARRAGRAGGGHRAGPRRRSRPAVALELAGFRVSPSP